MNQEFYLLYLSNFFCIGGSEEVSVVDMLAPDSVSLSESLKDYNGMNITGDTRRLTKGNNSIQRIRRNDK